MDDSALAPLLYNSKAIAWPQERSDIKLNWLNWIVLTVFWFLACKKGERVLLSALQILRCIVWSRRWLVPSNSSIIRAGGCSVINKKYGWFIIAMGGGDHGQANWRFGFSIHKWAAFLLFDEFGVVHKAGGTRQWWLDLRSFLRGQFCTSNTEKALYPGSDCCSIS